MNSSATSPVWPPCTTNRPAPSLKVGAQHRGAIYRPGQCLRKLLWWLLVVDAAFFPIFISSVIFIYLFLLFICTFSYFMHGFKFLTPLRFRKMCDKNCLVIVLSVLSFCIQIHFSLILFYFFNTYCFSVGIDFLITHVVIGTLLEWWHWYVVI